MLVLYILSASAVISAILWVVYKLISFAFDSINPFRETPESVGKATPLIDRKDRDVILRQAFSTSKVPSGTLDAIVIGSGIGGLSTAAILAKMGRRVLVLERHDRAGGGCHTFTTTSADRTYEFDSGLHYVGKMGRYHWERTLMDQLTDGQLQWAPMDEVYDMLLLNYSKPSEEQKTVELRASVKNWQTSLAQQFPTEAENIAAYWKHCESVTSRLSMTLILCLKCVPRWITTFLDTMGILGHLPFFKTNGTVSNPWELVQRYTSHPELQAALLYFWGNYGVRLDKGSATVHALHQEHYTVDGGYYPVGGPSEIPLKVIPVIERAGGKVLVRAEVAKILTNKNGAAVGVVVRKTGSRDMSGQCAIYAKCVISNAGVLNTFGKLLPPELSQRCDISSSILANPAYEQSLTFLSVFVGLSLDNDELPVKMQNTWAYESANIVESTNNYLNLSVKDAIDKDPAFLFISFPSKKDPAWKQRFPGKSTLVILTMTNSQWFAEWKDKPVTKRGDDYEALKNIIGWRMIEHTERLFPCIKGKIDDVAVGSALSNAHYLGSPNGEVYGLDQIRSRFNPDTLSLLRPETEVPNLYLTGQDIVTGGFCGALWSGLVTSTVITGRPLIIDLMRQHNRVQKS